ncbi:hypothetical protein mRhiFer1_009207 [Rhinolophus ferrumequinum]|uniref:Uncharacterized protein n=1 Tax=Rhinolophus ferrumequinum TaxID=59479 RepID=A0A7J7SJM5_RHIFE|nr:hypothetical protein mRhiFer1_009207 [Rhinolophus ferrumequinum]
MRHLLSWTFEIQKAFTHFPLGLGTGFRVCKGLTLVPSISWHLEQRQGEIHLHILSLFLATSMQRLSLIKLASPCAGQQSLKEGRDPGVKQLRQRQDEGELACWVSLPQAYLFLPMFGEGRERGGNFSRLEIQEAVSPVHHRASAPRAQVCGSKGT